MIESLKPQLTVEPRPADPHTARYVRSYLILPSRNRSGCSRNQSGRRVLIGVLGVALPLLLGLGDGLVFDEDPFPRGDTRSV